jgi:hypothetical protein
MPKYQTKDGEVFSVRNHTDLIIQLWAASRARLPLTKWMRDCAERAQTQTGQPVDGTTAQRLARGLLRTGLVHRIG